MKVTIPHNVGDKIETTVRRTKKLMCPVCKNQHQVVIKGEIFECPSCHGWTPEEDIEESIEVTISDVSVRVSNFWDEIEIETSYEVVNPFSDDRGVWLDTPSIHRAYVEK